MQITGLIRSKNKKKVNVYIDERYSFSVLENTIVDKNLYKGKNIDLKLISQVIFTDKRSQVISKCINLISRRPRSEFEIKQYLKRNIKKFDDIDKLIQEVILKLKEKEYINDKGFIKWWISNRNLFQNKSIVELKKELRSKGIKDEFIKEYFDTDGLINNEIENAKKIYLKKKQFLKQKKFTKKELEFKLKQYLYRRGFNLEIINSIIK